MGIRTDISEDPKGDPTKLVPSQPDPATGRPPGVEPLLPKPDRQGAAPPGRHEAETPADRRASSEDQEQGK